MTSGVGPEFPQVDSDLEYMLSLAIAERTPIDPALSQDLPGGYDAFMPDAAPQDFFYNTPESFPYSDEYREAPVVATDELVDDTFESFVAHSDEYHEAPVAATNELVYDTPESLAPHSEEYHKAPTVVSDDLVDTDADAEDEDEDEEVAASEHWETLVNFSIPDSTQSFSCNIPELQALYTQYLNSYNPSSHTPNTTRMQYAKALIYAMLTHYYPVSKGYTVAPTSIGPLASRGMNFILAASDNSDLYPDPPAKKKSRANSSKKTKKREPIQAKKVLELRRGMTYLMGLKYDAIAPEDIAAFVVLRKKEEEEEEEEEGEVLVEKGDGAISTCTLQPYTYAYILLPQWDTTSTTTLPRYSSSNKLHRSDVLLDALYTGGNIRHGYGFLLFGPLIEFYKLHAGEEWEFREIINGDSEDEEVQDVEMEMELMAYEGREGSLDMRSNGLGDVDGVFRRVGEWEVGYREG
ncbi:hypothetical protein GMOD_00000954 [Pyrenophora seminiperda CCB06]|uniref:Uncharacterized protein n=1 Tax=Pyrenophora seminiperda CCB06 TaxID=1302712 RepID=A0A3M7LXV7_9PLEO|nr:hypothetical protein GMOD_00000954 [Pyrenophora seminiperda CCB06]